MPRTTPQLNHLDRVDIARAASRAAFDSFDPFDPDAPVHPVHDDLLAIARDGLEITDPEQLREAWSVYRTSFANGIHHQRDLQYRRGGIPA